MISKVSPTVYIIIDRETIENDDDSKSTIQKLDRIPIKKYHNPTWKELKIAIRNQNFESWSIAS